MKRSELKLRSKTTSDHVGLTQTLVSLEEIQFDNDTSNQRTMVDATMQFPLDIAEDVFHEHSFFFFSFSHIFIFIQAYINFKKAKIY